MYFKIKVNAKKFVRIATAPLQPSVIKVFDHFIVYNSLLALLSHFIEVIEYYRSALVVSTIYRVNEADSTENTNLCD